MRCPLCLGDPCFGPPCPGALPQPAEPSRSLGDNERERLEAALSDARERLAATQDALEIVRALSSPVRVGLGEPRCG